MKSGKSIFAICSILFIGIVMKNIFFDPFEQYKKNPNIAQYLNRLVEFFDISYIKIIESKFLEMVDYGLDPSEAFNLLVSKVM
jgi:hypothetical protein